MLAWFYSFFKTGVRSALIGIRCQYNIEYLVNEIYIPFVNTQLTDSFQLCRNYLTDRILMMNARTLSSLVSSYTTKILLAILWARRQNIIVLLLPGKLKYTNVLTSKYRINFRFTLHIQNTFFRLMEKPNWTKSTDKNLHFSTKIKLLLRPKSYHYSNKIAKFNVSSTPFLSVWRHKTLIIYFDLAIITSVFSVTMTEVFPTMHSKYAESERCSFGSLPSHCKRRLCR